MTMPLRAPGEDIEQRRPVWLALSDLFLDTDVSLSLEWRARQLADSPYSEDELERILIDEVHPACWANLLSVPGNGQVSTRSGWSGGYLDARVSCAGSSIPRSG